MLPPWIKIRIRRSILAKKIGSSQATNARFHIKPGMSRSDFFSTLNQRKIRYVLLRWWKDFPVIPKDEDLDILIDDDDRDNISDLLVRLPNENKCDIYTVTGSKFGGYNDLPYFSHKLSIDLLKERVLYKGLVYVPSPKLHFSSMAYHALFHKGCESGVTGFSTKTGHVEHDYPEILKSLSQSIGLKHPVDALGIYSALSLQGYVPQDDLLAKLRVLKPELELFSTPLFCDSRGGEFMAFVVRESVVGKEMLDVFLHFISKNFGLEILNITKLTATKKEQFRNAFRGGRWDKGPYPKSGGDPQIVIFCYDYHPSPLSTRDQKKYPSITNLHTLDIKNLCRDQVFKWNFWFDHFNALHSADNEKEAIHFLELALEDQSQELLKKVEARRNQYFTSHPVRKLISTGWRSKVELINFEEKLAIKKTFRPGFERYLEREMYAEEKLSLKYDFIPKLLSKGFGFIIVEFIETKPIPNTIEVRAHHQKFVYTVITSMYKEGLEYINFTPENTLFDQNGRFYAIDFEFLQPCDVSIPTVEDSIMISGLSNQYSGDTPAGNYKNNSSFKKVWQPIVGNWCDLVEYTNK